jgi:hypothetical protein
MSKVKLSKAELAALDALIASYETDSTMVASGPESLAFITAIARTIVAVTKVAVKVTPVAVNVATAVAGGAAANSHKEGLAQLTGKNGELSLEALIKLRNEANK